MDWLFGARRGGGPRGERIPADINMASLLDQIFPAMRALQGLHGLPDLKMEVDFFRDMIVLEGEDLVSRKDLEAGATLGAACSGLRRYCHMRSYEIRPAACKA